MKQHHILNLVIFTTFLMCWLITPLVAFSVDSTAKKVFVMQIRSEIDPRTSRYVEKALATAEAQKVNLIIIDMDTYGGMLKSADEIRSKLLEFI